MEDEESTFGMDISQTYTRVYMPNHNKGFFDMITKPIEEEEKADKVVKEKNIRIFQRNHADNPPQYKCLKLLEETYLKNSATFATS
eukprot:snap_masked-scaffold_13-processed-gene-9.41-mRNA-1 protein AED:1.00 eAED:1.00 QI:0/-1/0/0/-1/1/1/0/85